MSRVRPVLHNLLNSGFLIENETRKTTVRLIEKNCKPNYHQDVELGKGIISYFKLPEDGKPFFRLFKQTASPAINKRCDYIVFKEDLEKNNFWIYYIELKTTLQECRLSEEENNYDLSDLKKQLISSYCLLHYVFNYLKHFGNDLVSQFDNTYEQFICFNASHQPKAETNPKRFFENLKPFSISDWCCEQHSIIFYKYDKEKPIKI